MVNKWVRSPVRVIEWMARQLHNIAAYLIGAMMLIVVFDVTMRYVFVRPTYWAVDVSEYILLYSTILAAAWLLREERHVRITILTDRLGPKAKSITHFITSVVGVIICGVAAQETTTILLAKIARGAMVPRTFEIPQWTIIVGVPIGLAFLGIYFIRSAVVTVMSARHQETPEK